MKRSDSFQKYGTIEREMNLFDECNLKSKEKHMRMLSNNQPTLFASKFKATYTKSVLNLSDDSLSN